MSKWFNSVMIDASSNPFEKNISLTREVVDKFHPLGILVEAELGHIGAEMIYEEALANYGYTQPGKHLRGTNRCGLLAIAIGNMVFTHLRSAHLLWLIFLNRSARL